MIGPPICFLRNCRHYIGISKPDGTELTEIPVCSAFPNGIPEGILIGENKHTSPFPGDKGIRFEPATKI